MGTAWRGVRDLFRRARLEAPELEARLLAEIAFGMDRLELVNRERELAGTEALQKLQDLAARRLRGEPIDRVLGEKEFWGLKFKLNKKTLSPRPETEMLVARGLEELTGIAEPRLLDLGTGTGCIPIALLTVKSRARAVAIDLAAEAIAAARFNAERHGVAARLETRKGSWFDPIEPSERFDLITSNPPYIETAVIPTLAVEVRHHDPRLALDGGKDGLAAYRAIAGEANLFLKPEGVMLLEIGATQGAKVTAILRAAGFADIAIEPDLAGHQRMIVARLR